MYGDTYSHVNALWKHKKTIRPTYTCSIMKVHR